MERFTFLQRTCPGKKIIFSLAKIQERKCLYTMYTGHGINLSKIQHCSFLDTKLITFARTEIKKADHLI